MEAFRLMPKHRTTSRRSWPTPRTTGARPLRAPPMRLTHRDESRTRTRKQHMKTKRTPGGECPPGGASSATSTASPRRAATDFGALLDQHQARTAIAEGPKKNEARLDRQASAPAAAREAQSPVEAKPAEARCREARRPEAEAATEQQPRQAGGDQ